MAPHGGWVLNKNPAALQTWLEEVAIFPGKGFGPGFSLCAVPFRLGVVGWGGGGLPLHKNSGLASFTREKALNTSDGRCSKKKPSSTKIALVRSIF